MQVLPHHYVVAAVGSDDGDIDLTSGALPRLPSAAPAEFGGPGDRWSPETLLVGAVADCFVLTFRGIARKSRLPWTSLRCEATGTLDRVAGVTQFTHLSVRAHLTLPFGADPVRAHTVLESAERNCLVANSLKAEVHLEPDIVMAEEPAGALVGA